MLACELKMSCFHVLTEKLSQAKEENLDMHQMLDQTLIELNNLWTHSLEPPPPSTHTHTYIVVWHFLFAPCLPEAPLFFLLSIDGE